MLRAPLNRDILEVADVSEAACSEPPGRDPAFLTERFTRTPRFRCHPPHSVSGSLQFAVGGPDRPHAAEPRVSLHLSRWRAGSGFRVCVRGFPVSSWVQTAGLVSETGSPRLLGVERLSRSMRCGWELRPDVPGCRELAQLPRVAGAVQRPPVLAFRDRRSLRPPGLSVSVQVAQNRTQHPQEERHLGPGL